MLTMQFCLKNIAWFIVYYYAFVILREDFFFLFFFFFFFLHFISMENDLRLTMSYQEQLVIFVPVLCFQIFTVRNNFIEKNGSDLYCSKLEF